MSTPSLRIHVLPRLPENLVGTSGVAVSRSGGETTIVQDWSGITETAPVTLAGYSTLVFNNATRAFEVVPSDTAIPVSLALRALADGTDLNTIVTVDRVAVTNPVNPPAAGSGLRWIVRSFVDPNDADGVVQEATLLDGGTTADNYTRRRSLAGVWSAWANPAASTIATASDVDTSDVVSGKGLFWDGTAGKHVYAWASPKDATIDLRDLMDEHYGTGAWTRRTGTNTGSDIAPAITLGLDRLRAAYGRGKIYIAPGASWMQKTVLDPAKLSGIVIEGLHSLASGIVFSGNGNFLDFSGAAGLTGGAIRRLGMFREDGYSSASIAMNLDGDGTYQPDQFDIEDIYCSAIGTGFWTANLVCSGQDRTSPQGLRVGTIRNVQLFKSGAGGGYSAGFFNAVQWSVDNLGTYNGTGALANNVYVGGGGTASTNTTQFSLERLACGGELNLTNSTRCRIDGFCNSLALATTADFYNGWIDTASTAGSLGANSNLTIR